jgi:hypothetical protein
LTGGAIVAVTLFRSGPLTRPGQPEHVPPAPAATPIREAGPSPA